MACPSKWLTPINGILFTWDKVLAKVRPTNKPPTNPGPAVAAIKPISVILSCCFSNIRLSILSLYKTWVLAASSGTTPL